MASRVAYLESQSLIKAADALPANLGRAELVHALIVALQLLDDPTNTEDDGEDVNKTARVVPSHSATRDELLRFHDLKFLGTHDAAGERGILTASPPKSDALLGTEQEDSSSDESGSESGASTPRSVGNFRLRPSDAPSPSKRRKTDAFGLEDDCPVFDLLPSYVVEVAGASIQAARELRDGRASVACAWTGGRCAFLFREDEGAILISSYKAPWETG